MFLILQPCIPKYRLPFYQKVAELAPKLIKILSSDFDADGLKSVATNSSGIEFEYCLKEHRLFFGKLLWQQGIPFKSLNNYQGIVITGNPRYLSNYLVLLICKLKGKPVYWYGQGWSAKTSNLSFKIRLSIMKLFDGVILYTESDFEKVREHFSDLSRLTYLNNGLDYNSIQKNLKIALEEPTPLKVAREDQLNLVFIGRINEKSNLLFVLKALQKTDLPIHFTIIGDGELLGACENLTFPSSVSVEFTGALYEESHIAKHLAHCDFFVYGGAVGLSLIHAFSYNVPAIVHSNKKEHMPEIAALTEGENGLCFEKLDMQSFLNTLSKAFSVKTAGELSRYKANSGRVAKEKFNVNFMASQLVDFLERSPR
ncbi:glycosyltransferase [Catenovulum agarivorans]|uniref:glycosyltransferase n=1 Tax=Catenovulum agarivorans TaxID=1172192 RepID=UPI00031A5A12|nr:glycosyltransferase [Catenovulum agarivorans]